MKKETIHSTAIRNPIPSHPLATQAGPFLFMSGQMGLSEASGRPVATYRELGGEPPYPALRLLAPNTWEEAFVAQTRRIYDRIGTLLAERGSTLQDIVFHSVYLRDMRNFPTLARTRSRLFAGGLAPPVTTSQVGALPLDDAVVYFDPIGFVATEGYRLDTLRSAALEQAALSNYQFGSKVGPLMFFAGVVAAEPEKGKIIHGPRDLPPGVRLGGAPASPAAAAFRGPIRAQTAFVYDLFDRFLREQGAAFEDVIKLNIYLRDVRDTDVVEEVAHELAPRSRPAIALYGVESLATRFFLVEIEGIAALADAGRELLTRLDGIGDTIVPQGRHALAHRVGPLVFTSTITALIASEGVVLDDPAHLPERGRRAVEAMLRRQPALARTTAFAQTAAQAWLIYDRLCRIAEHFGVPRDGFLKTNVYLADMADLAAIEELAAEFFPHERPALAVIQAAGLSMPNARVQIDAVMLGAG